MNNLIRLQNCNKENRTTAVYNGKTVTVITIFSDIDVAIVEDEDGEIFDVQNSQLR